MRIPFTSEECIGMMVLCRSNEDEPFMVGVFKGWDETCHYMPMVEDEKGKLWYIGGHIVPYNGPIANMLRDLPPKIGYDILSEILMFNNIDRAQRNKQLPKQAPPLTPKRPWWRFWC